MQSKKLIPIIIFSFAGILLIIGFIQIMLFATPQFDMLNDARLQGVPENQISQYVSQQLMPQLLAYITVSLGITTLLVSCGLISLQIAAKSNREEYFVFEEDEANFTESPAPVKAPPAVSANQETRQKTGKALKEDDFFKDFEVIEDKLSFDEE
ncbi:MAG: hypothetical protein FWE65_01800 [Eggerthellaceae bacterium]|nr:hypothetical protein [Eggerthellaceae bacterium]